MLHFTERIGAETDLDFIKENELRSKKKLLCTLFERSYERVSCHQAKGMGNSE